jgi:DNA-directed RNA polymerase III subunit RPC6
MLANLTPSVELTGGPWFTDNELDTEFVDLLKKCAYRYLEMNVSTISSPLHPPS